jgi:hypothetical protein
MAECFATDYSSGSVAVDSDQVYETVKRPCLSTKEEIQGTTGKTKIRFVVIRCVMQAYNFTQSSWSSSSS